MIETAPASYWSPVAVHPTRRNTSCLVTVSSFLCYASKPLPSPASLVSYILGQPADCLSVLRVIWWLRKLTVKVSNRVRCVVLWVDTSCSEELVYRRSQTSRSRRGKSRQREVSIVAVVLFSNLRIPGIVFVQDKLCISIASTAFVRKYFPSDK